MGAKINITYDSKVVSNDDILMLSNALPKIVTEAMHAGDVFLYVDTVHSTVEADPIEIFIQVNIAKVASPNELLEDISKEVSSWKQENNFIHPLNINVLPVEWHSRIAV